MTVYASRRRRVAALLIDSIILAPNLVLLLLIFLYLPTLFVVAGLYLCMVPAIYWSVMTVRSGQTLGARWMGLKVIRTNGELLSYRAVFLREIATASNSLLIWLQGLYLIGLMRRLKLPDWGLQKAFDLSYDFPNSSLDFANETLNCFALMSLAYTFLNKKKRTLEDFVAGSVVVVVEVSDSAGGPALGK